MIFDCLRVENKIAVYVPRYVHEKYKIAVAKGKIDKHYAQACMRFCFRQMLKASGITLNPLEEVFPATSKATGALLPTVEFDEAHPPLNIINNFFIIKEQMDKGISGGVSGMDSLSGTTETKEGVIDAI